MILFSEYFFFRSANFEQNYHSQAKIKKFIAKSVAHVNINSHFKIENSASVKSNNPSSGKKA